MSGDRPATPRYLHQICSAAEDNGFEAVLTPTGLWCEDAWLTMAMLVESTETLKFLVAFRPGLLSPTLVAQMAGTFQRHSQGRLLLNVVTGGEPHEQRAYGDFLDKEARYARTAEFLHVVRQLWTSPQPVTFAGEHIRVEGAQTEQPTRPDTRGVLRRLLGVGRAGGRQALRRLPHLGRTADRGRQEAGLGPRAGRLRRANPAVRLVDSRDQPRHLGRCVGRGRPAAVGDRPGRHRAGAGQPGAQRVRGPAPDAGAARRRQRQTACRSEPVGRGRPGARGAGTALVGSHAEVAAGRILQTGHHSLHPVGVSASGRGLLVRRGRAARCWSGWGCGGTPIVGRVRRRRRRSRWPRRTDGHGSHLARASARRARRRPSGRRIRRAAAPPTAHRGGRQPAGAPPSSGTTSSCTPRRPGWSSTRCSSQAKVI